MSHQKYILIFDDTPLNSNVVEYFANFNYDIVISSELSKLNSDTIHADAILINVSLIKNNLIILKTFYTNHRIPLLVLSDVYDEALCIKMLEAGADDFVVKSLHPRELYARINAINRRIMRKSREIEQEKEVLTFAHWRLYPASRQLFDENAEEMPLSAGEYDLLFAFIKQPQRILPRELLLQITKSTDLTPFDRRIDVQISRLRQKIEQNPKKPVLIKTIRNGGYLFTSPVVPLKVSEQKNYE